MSYEEGTVGFLIEQLNNIKDKNKKVYWVETQYDDYACYGDGFTTTFHLVDGLVKKLLKMELFLVVNELIMVKNHFQFIA